MPLVFCLVAFILTFFVTRLIVRYIRAHQGSDKPRRWWQPRNLGTGSGLHIHHVVIGVILVMISGVTMVTLAVDGGVPEFTAAAILFGIGAALVLDEFALILHLEDVYWSEDGRTSVDAVFAAVAVTGLLILGFNPLSFFDIDIWRNDHSVTARVFVIAVAVLTLMLAVVVLLKGKVWTGLVGMFITPLLVVGAIRLSRPHAPWARWRYTDHPRKMHRALERERYMRRPVVQAKLWLQDAIAGMPKFPDDAKVDEQLDREIRAAPAPKTRTASEEPA
ncbi:membrane protein [Mycolicibacterium phlei DSM 43072]|nr:membrane protein [Mycolicibacterium phlei DSM 43070]KXW70163.1 membrane protein [Mycolicibacterium phlei DSM 43072]